MCRSAAQAENGNTFREQNGLSSVFLRPRLWFTLRFINFTRRCSCKKASLPLSKSSKKVELRYADRHINLLFCRYLQVNLPLDEPAYRTLRNADEFCLSEGLKRI